MTAYPTLGELLDRSVRDLYEAHGEAVETMGWLARCCSMTEQRKAEFDATSALCSRIYFAIQVRLATEMVAR